MIPTIKDLSKSCKHLVNIQVFTTDNGGKSKQNDPYDAKIPINISILGNNPVFSRIQLKYSYAAIGITFCSSIYVKANAMLSRIKFSCI